MSVQSAPKSPANSFWLRWRKKSTPFWGRATHRNNHPSSSHNLDTAECPSILFSPNSGEILYMTNLGILCDTLILLPNIPVFLKGFRAGFISDFSDNYLCFRKCVTCISQNLRKHYAGEQAVLVEINKQSLCHKAVAWLLFFLLNSNFQKILDFRTL